MAPDKQLPTPFPHSKPRLTHIAILEQLIKKTYNPIFLIKDPDCA